MNEILLPSETIVYKCEIFYGAPDKNVYQAQVQVSESQLIVKLSQKESASEYLSGLAVIKFVQGFNVLIIKKNDIQNVEIHGGFISNKCIVTLTDQSVHIFDRRALKVNELAEFIKASTKPSVPANNETVRSSIPVINSETVRNSNPVPVKDYNNNPDEYFSWSKKAAVLAIAGLALFFTDGLMFGLLQYILFLVAIIVSIIQLLAIYKNFAQVKGGKTSLSIGIFIALILVTSLLLAGKTLMDLL